MAACPMSAMHFTGSRAIAEKIKEVCPRLLASTGGPNTIIADKAKENILDMVRMSNTIENKGQCTALRHFVCAEKVDQGMLEKMYAKAPVIPGVLSALENGNFDGIYDPKNYKFMDYGVLPGYQAIKSAAGGAVQVKINNEGQLPYDIEENWRKIYMDVTVPPQGFSKDFLDEFCRWLNYEQPISLAINCDDSYKTAEYLWERTGLVVVTVGSHDTPALTAQARPQDGEVFGEVPPRRLFKKVSYLPMLNPVPCPAYTSRFDDGYLMKKGINGSVSTFIGRDELNLHEDAIKLLSYIKNPTWKGYAMSILEYVLELKPSRGFGTRTALFGMQRPPLDGSVSCS